MRGAIFWSFIFIVHCYSMQDQPIMLDFDSLYLPTHFTYFDQACKQLWSDLDLISENPELLHTYADMEDELAKKLEYMVSRLQLMASSEESRMYLKDDVDYAINCIALVFEKYQDLEHVQWGSAYIAGYDAAIKACNQLYSRSCEQNS